MIHDIGHAGDVATQPETLATRPVAYSMITELFRVQADAVPRNKFRRMMGVSPVHPDAESWFSGAHGELKMGELLSQLGPEWLVLHAVPVGTGESDIDHVIVGPGGVFTINTKRHERKKIWVGERILLVAGQKSDHLRNSRHEAKRASKLLSVVTGSSIVAHPVIAVVGASSFTFKQRPKDVSVMDARRVPRWLKHRPPVLSAKTVQRISAAAVDPRTWHPSADLTIDPTYLDRFRVLDRQVVSARRRRLLWAAVVTLGIAVVAYVYVLPAVTSLIVAAISGIG
ncbi:nuclease-related domain-containing protein [Salinibacterium sp. M195]|uniref:nuclease-related domain-containing protein n=1 Tax=Salinibacterium sp. M195 TaxID=2583374 RepID=UPI001C62B0F3|nr:nuclease-related domain-containing protein [Salinibacterium sp. M195]QYH35485.1 NERD domain-containing protein [Salinibacterium sp. M195]